MNSRRGRVSNSALNKKLRKIFLDVSIIVSEEILSYIEEEKHPRLWVRKWIGRRDSRGMSTLLLKELSLEDPEEYRNCLRLTPAKFESLLKLIAPVIQRSNTMQRDAIPARLKLEVTLNFLATGNSYRTLQHMFRIPKPTISNFVPEVCEAIFANLKEFIKVRYK